MDKGKTREKRRKKRCKPILATGQVLHRPKPARQERNTEILLLLSIPMLSSGQYDIEMNQACGSVGKNRENSKWVN
jgi:hypothetical protein